MKEILLIILFLLHAVHSCPLEDCSNTSTSISVNYDNQLSIFHSLQEALDYVTSHNISQPTMCLPPGTHTVSNQIHFGQQSLRLIGSENTTIICDYDPLPLKEGIDYTWHFNRSEFFCLSGIHFSSCPYPYRVIAVKEVTVRNCTFRNFTEAVFDLFNCETVQLEHSSFTNNSGTGILFETFRGNTGAVALGYTNYPDGLKQPQVSISHCEFIGNKAHGTTELQTSERAVASSIFIGRGGALGIFIGSASSSPILNMSKCLISGNYAHLFGGGIYTNINSIGTNVSFTFSKVNIIGNTISRRVQTGGGGVQVAFLSGSDSPVPPHSVVFRDCNFENNVGESGGGIYVFTPFVGTHGFYSRLEGCNFTNNRGYGTVNEFGAAVAISLAKIFVQRVTAERHDIVNCSFYGNSGRNGIVSIGYSPTRFSGINEFVNNSGASVRIVGSLVDFYDEVTFMENHNPAEGALSILSFGQIRIHKGLHIDFIGNMGRLGASITVSTPNSFSAFSNLLGNPACFAIYEENRLSPTDWIDVSVNFDNNTAVLSSALYISRLGQCSWFSYSPPYFRDTSVLDWPIWEFGDNTNTGYMDSQNTKYYVGSLPIDISVNVDNISSWPGKNFEMSVHGVDQFGHVTSINTRLYQAAMASQNMPTLKFSPEIVVNAGSSGRHLTDKFPITYSVASEEAFSEIINRSAVVGIEEPFDASLTSDTNFSLRANSCPGGHKLMGSMSQSESESVYTCQCLDIPQVIKCEDDQDSIIIKDGYWAGYVEAGTPNLFFHSCPPGYCQCSLNSSLGSQKCVYTYTHSQQDLQCTPEREGILCGSCKAEYGVSVLRNKCVSCSNGYISLLVVLVFLEVCVLVLIVVIDRPISSWLYSFIFYVQIAPYMMGYFSESFQTVGVYMTYLQSALGMYLVYDFCLFNNLHPLLSYLLRYIPTISTTIVFTSIWIARKSRCLKMKSLNHHGYWLIVILLYPQLVHTSISLLNCPQLPDSTGATSARWLVDGSVECFRGWHLPLTVLAISVLFICFSSVIFTIIITVKIPLRFKKLIPPMTVAYQESQWLFAGMELGRRLLLLILIITFPLNRVYVILILVIILSAYAYFMPYKSRIANATEVVVLLNLVIILLLSTTPLVRESFGALTEVNPGNWLLYILYYLPIVLLFALGISLTAHILLRVIQKKARENHSDVDTTAMDNQTSAREDTFCKSTSYSLHITRGTGGGEALVMEVEQSTNEL